MHNSNRHKNSDFLFGHFSVVDKFDTDRFPKLKFTKPIKFKLNKGESIYIPKGWWHWIKSTSKSFAINYWFLNKNNLDPFIFNHSTKYDINLFKGQDVYVWDSFRDDGVSDYILPFNEFYESKLDNRYILTLDQPYPHKSLNYHLKNIIKPYIKFPIHEKLSYKNTFDFNIWISSGKHDTGLHYDDEDGVLSLIEGSKEIILFPPSDSENLYPISVEYNWKNNKALNFWYNSFDNHGTVKGISSSELLYVTCKKDVRVLSNISKLYNKFKTNLIWAYKKSNDGYRWEIYKYYPYRTKGVNPVIISWDLFNNSYNIPDIEHHYFRDTNYPSTPLPFWGNGKYKKSTLLDIDWSSKYKKDGKYSEESKIFVIDNYSSFNDNYNQYMNELGYGEIKEEFKDIILNKYQCYQICIHNKTKNQIFVQYLGISNENFLSFLTLNEYPSHVIDFIEEQVKLNRYNINNEITIVYEISSQKVIRSGFYGNI